MTLNKVTFTSRHLKSLVDSEHSCVELHEKCRRTLNLLPLHLENLRHSVKELLDGLVTTYDLELKGIILSHKNVKIEDSVPLGDSGSFRINFLADIYLFKPKIGSTLSGVINKKGSDDISLLVHSLFNVSIPKRFAFNAHHLNIGDTVIFKVNKLDFSSRLPFIRGEIIDNGSSCKSADDIDSGCQSSADNDLETSSNVRMNKRIVFNDNGVVSSSGENDENKPKPFKGILKSPPLDMSYTSEEAAGEKKKKKRKSAVAFGDAPVRPDESLGQDDFNAPSFSKQLETEKWPPEERGDTQNASAYFVNSSQSLGKVKKRKNKETPEDNHDGDKTVETIDEGTSEVGVLPKNKRRSKESGGVEQNLSSDLHQFAAESHLEGLGKKKKHKHRESLGMEPEACLTYSNSVDNLSVNETNEYPGEVVLKKKHKHRESEGMKFKVQLTDSHISGETTENGSDKIVHKKKHKRRESKEMEPKDQLTDNFEVNSLEVVLKKKRKIRENEGLESEGRLTDKVLYDVTENSSEEIINKKHNKHHESRKMNVIVQSPTSIHKPHNSETQSDSRELVKKEKHKKRGSQGTEFTSQDISVKTYPPKVQSNPEDVVHKKKHKNRKSKGGEQPQIPLDPCDDPISDTVLERLLDSHIAQSDAVQKKASKLTSKSPSKEQVLDLKPEKLNKKRKRALEGSEDSSVHSTGESPLRKKVKKTSNEILPQTDLELVQQQLLSDSLLSIPNSDPQVKIRKKHRDSSVSGKKEKNKKHEKSKCNDLLNITDQLLNEFLSKSGQLP